MQPFANDKSLCILAHILSPTTTMLTGSPYRGSTTGCGGGKTRVKRHERGTSFLEARGALTAAARVDQPGTGKEKLKETS